ncbi:putative muscle myosin heavy chain [Ixodes scapularis]
MPAASLMGGTVILACVALRMGTAAAGSEPGDKALSQSFPPSERPTGRLAQLEAALLEKDAVVRALQEQSVQRASEVDELRQALLKAEQRHEKAKTDYAELLRTWQEFESSNESGEHTFVQVEARPGALRRQLEEARKEVQDKLVALAERERQLTGLRDERTRLRQELELMPPLQAQVDLFRTDYMAEKEARVGLESRVREQQRTIRELQERLTGLELAEQRTSRAQPAESQAPPGHESASPTDSNLPCPLCGASCSTRDAYIRHVQSCADSDAGFR